MINQVDRNTRVLTTGGMYGTIVSVDKDAGTVLIRLGNDPGVKVEFARSAIAQVLDGADKDEEGRGLSRVRRRPIEATAEPGRPHAGATGIPSRITGHATSDPDDKPPRGRCDRRAARIDHEQVRRQVHADRDHDSPGPARLLAAVDEAQDGHRPLGRHDPRLRDQEGRPAGQLRHRRADHVAQAADQPRGRARHPDPQARRRPDRDHPAQGLGRGGRGGQGEDDQRRGRSSSASWPTASTTRASSTGPWARTA